MFDGAKGWPWTRRREGADQRQDELLAAILRVLAEHPADGLEVSLRLQEAGRFPVEGGAIYPFLQLLDDRGFVTLATLHERKVYQVTEAGHAFLASRTNRDRPTQEDDPDEFFERPRREDWMGGWTGSREDWFGGRGHHGHHGWSHHGWGHHGRGRHEQWREMGFDPREFRGLWHDLKGLMRQFKHAARHGQLDRERITRIRDVVQAAAKEIEAVLRQAPARQDEAI